MATYSALFDALGLRAWCDAGGAAKPLSLADLAGKRGIAMPIVDAVARLLAGAAPARQVVAELLSRPLRAEGEQA